MASLTAAHKGYFYQDLATAYFLARSLVEPVRSTVVDAKHHSCDLFDDLLTVHLDRSRVRRQFKHSDDARVFERSCLSTLNHDLRLDLLIQSWKSDSRFRIQKYRICVTWGMSSLRDDRLLLRPSQETSSFEGESRCFHLNTDHIWPSGGAPTFTCLGKTRRADFLAFAKRLVIELGCPRASRDLDRPGLMEHLLLRVLADRVGFGRYPNEQRSPIQAAAQLILLASRTRGAELQDSALSPDQVISALGLVTDYGRITQLFPFKSKAYVSIPNLRRKLIERLGVGGITVLSGGPGSGKSWELTDLVKTMRAGKTIVAEHYCYLEPGDPIVQSRITLNAFYGNLIAAIIDAAPNLGSHSPTRYASGPRELQALLDAVGKEMPTSRLVLIVDGLDHIERVLRDIRSVAPADTQIARELMALKLPKNVSVIVGSQPGDHITKLAASGTVLQMPAWDEPECEVFLSRIPLGRQLKALRIRIEDRTTFIAELTKRSQGNALYCTYLCRELEGRLQAIPGSQPLTLLRELPGNDGKLSTYYDFLLGSLDSGGRMIGEAMGLIDFGVTTQELQDIFPFLQGSVEAIIAQLAPILERTRGQGGLRIYHESFRRYLLDKGAVQPGSLSGKLKEVIAWLEGKGFLDDPRAFRFLLPNLVRAERSPQVLTQINRDFVIRAVMEGHANEAIAANLSLYAQIASEVGDFSHLVRCNELTRALWIFNDNLSEAFDYGTTYAALYGIGRLAERLAFDGTPTFAISQGLRLCSLCADKGVAPPWHAYLRKEAGTSTNRDQAAEEARFHGLMQSGETDRLRVRLVNFLGKPGSDLDPGYVAGLARRWAERVGADDLPRVRRESKCNPMIAELFDLEFARVTTNQQKRRAAVNRVARRTTNAKRANQALQLGANPKIMSHWVNDFDKYQIGLGERGVIGEGDALSQWVLAIRIAAHIRPEVLAVEQARIQGEGWYRKWLAFVISLARIECHSGGSPNATATSVVEAFQALGSNVHAFTGSPRACDLYHGHGAIRDSLRDALNLLQTIDQWRRVIAHLKKISSGTTTYLQSSKGGPLTSRDLVELIAPFAQRGDLQALIRLEIEPLVSSQHRSGLYVEIAMEEMTLASLLVTMNDRAAALSHWQSACVHLCAYGMRKDITIHEVLNPVHALLRGGKQQVLERLAQLRPMVNAVVQHTDGKGTWHAIGSWFRELCAADEVAAAWVLGHSMVVDGGNHDYRLESGLKHWVERAGAIDAQLRCRLEQLIEGPSDLKEIERRLERIESLRAHDAEAAALEFQLLAAAVHGDSMESSKEPHGAVRAYALKTGYALPIGEPDIGYQPHKDTTPTPPPKSMRAKNIRWKLPKNPSDLANQLRVVLIGRATNNQIFTNCQGLVVAWSDQHGSEIEDILLVIARASRFGERAELLSELGTVLESAGKKALAARALTLSFANHRGGGGWMSFGDEKHENLLVRAFRASRQTALAVLAQEMAYRAGDLGVTRQVIEFFGRHDDVALATGMWDEARESLLLRLPGHELAGGPFRSFDPAVIPALTNEDAAHFLIMARISHPELRRKTAALSAAAWLVHREPIKCAPAIREILKAKLCFTHKMWLLNILTQIDGFPYSLTAALATDLNVIAGCGSCGLEQLAVNLLKRAKMAIVKRVTRSNPHVFVPVTTNRQAACLSLDRDGIVSWVAMAWPEFPEILAARMSTIFDTDKLQVDRMEERWKASRSRLLKSYPFAQLHYWEDEVFSENLHELLIGLEAHLWSKGKWDEGVWARLVPAFLKSIEIPVSHVWSRRVRPSWPLPSTIAASVQHVKAVPDGELSGWVRIAYLETHRICESRLHEITSEIRVTAGVMLDSKAPALAKGSLPLQDGNSGVWRRVSPALFSLDSFSGTIAGITSIGVPFEPHEILCLQPELASALELRPRSEIGPMDLYDNQDNLAVSYRWWRCYPLDDDGFAEENPRLIGGNLLMRPDEFDRLIAATNLQPFDLITVGVENAEQLIARRNRE